MVAIRSYARGMSRVKNSKYRVGFSNNKKSSSAATRGLSNDGQIFISVDLQVKIN